MQSALLRRDDKVVDMVLNSFFFVLPTEEETHSFQIEKNHLLVRYMYHKEKSSSVTMVFTTLPQ